VDRMFTLEEANALLPELAALLERARDAAVRAGGFEREMQELSQRIFLAGGMHVDVAAAARRRAERDKAVQEAQSCVEEIAEVGARVGDLESGRLEFPCTVDGRDVLLCWNLGEGDEIRFWREDAEGSELKGLGEGPFRRERDRPN
jgi:hypothetical protein